MSISQDCDEVCSSKPNAAFSKFQAAAAYLDIGKSPFSPFLLLTCYKVGVQDKKINK